MRQTLGLFLIGLVATAITASAQNDSMPGFESPQLHRWDAAHRVLFLGKNFVLKKDSPPLRSYYADGSQRGVDIHLFKDFPELQQASADDFAVGPGDTTLIAAMFNYGPKKIKHFILTYDLSGALRSVIDTEPYAAEAITSDDQGNIYLLGERTDEHEGDAPYPLLIEYDPSGRVIGRFLNSNLFVSGSEAVEDVGPGYELVSASVAPLDGKLFVYAPSDRDVVTISLDGTLVRHESLEAVAIKIGWADKVHRAAISDVAFVDKNHVVLYLTEHVAPDDPDATDYRNMHTAVYLVDMTTSQWKLILRGEPGINPAFLGVSGGRLFTVTRGTQGVEFHQQDLFDRAEN